jgi:predicted CXXCH cytochrome family protein
MADRFSPADDARFSASSGARRKLALFGALGIVLVSVVIVAWMQSNSDDEPVAKNRGNSPRREKVQEPSAWDGHLAASPYRNVRPDVNYVSDAKCADCHGEIAEAYAKHPMGRSLAPVAKATPIERFTAEARHPLAIDGFVYRVRQDDGRQFHKETRLSPAGNEALSMEFEAVYAVGSGTDGRSYIIERDAHLFMSPMTWYADHGWDLSPGYEVNNSHFNRPVVAECLFCHANRAAHVAGTLNEYKPPIFSGYSIGCQRCHGPGELHVAAQERGEPVGKLDTTIVNPADLAPPLRESVCQQCHLGGLVRLELNGRRIDDYRPGLPWSAAQAVYLAAGSKQPDATERDGDHAERFVGHVEQMHQSGCYVGGRGKLGCISCHDPHSKPEASARVEFYRQRCLQCHAEADCDLSLATRRQRQADDSCFSCHMPYTATQIRHAASTDHRIPRSPDARPRTPAVEPKPDWSPLLAFQSLVIANGDGGDAGEKPSASRKAELAADDNRNLAVALVRAMDRYSDLVDERVLPRVLKLLEDAVRRDPSDVVARDAYAYALGRNRDLQAALAQLEEVIKRQPRREQALAAAASMLMSVQQWESAAGLWERAREVNPWIVRYWTELALCQARLRRWDACAKTCEQSIERFPDGQGARQLLIECRLVAGRAAEAEQELNRMLELNPPKAESIRQWWEHHPLRADHAPGRPNADKK